MAKMILHHLHLRRIPVTDPNIDYVYATVPLLLDALHIGTEDGDTTVRVKIEDPVQVRNNLNSMGQQNRLEGLGETRGDEDSLETWIKLRDLVIGAWKGINWSQT